MTTPQGRNEGGAQTARILDAIRRRRAELGWSAQRLADEMTRAGIPWNADVVVNLEHGRRKSLRVHELMALMFVMDVADPLAVLVPGDEEYPVVPGVLANPDTVRAWLRGEDGPLRKTLSKGVPPGTLESVADLFDQQGRPELAEATRRIAGLIDVPQAGAGGQG